MRTPKTLRPTCRQVYDAGYSPICPVLFLPTFLKDEIPQEHKDGLDIARDYLRRSHVLVVCGHGIDETVKNDIATADRPADHRHYPGWHPDRKGPGARERRCAPC